MAETKYTPGPWHWSEQWEDEYCGGLHSASGAVLYGFGSHTDGGISLNNPFDARLISAAPEMAEALKHLLESWHDEGDHGGTVAECNFPRCKSAFAALQKAGVL